MTRIDTTRTHRPIDTGRRVHRADRTAEAVILAAGIVFGGLLVSVDDAYGADQTQLLLAAAPTASMLSTAPAHTDGLDLSMPTTSVAPATGARSAYPRNDGARVTDLNDRTRLRGVYSLEIDLYADDMQPRAGSPLQ